MARTESRTLKPKQCDLLYGMACDFSGGEKAFIERAMILEQPNKTASAGWPSKPQINNVMRHWRRIISEKRKGREPLTRAKLETYAKVLDMTPEDLCSLLSLSMPGVTRRAIPKTEIAEGAGPHPDYSRTPAIDVPWLTEESILKKYRTRFHHYHQTKQGDDVFWIYTPIDFSIPCKGYLCDPSYTIPDSKGVKIRYPVFGYLFSEMLLLILTSDKTGCLKEHVRVYHDFRKELRESLGHFGIHLNEDWNTDTGFGGCLIFDDRFPGTNLRGRQSPAICEALDERWRMIDGKRCSRLLYLFGHEPYSRPFISETKSQNSLGANKARKAKPRKKDI
jgi:hypothetical protein